MTNRILQETMRQLERFDTTNGRRPEEIRIGWLDYDELARHARDVCRWPVRDRKSKATTLCVYGLPVTTMLKTRGLEIR